MLVFLLVFALLFRNELKRTTKGKETTVTGCLSKAAGQAQYALKDDQTGKEMTVTGSSELEQHAANHTVKLTGNMSTDSGKSVFTASKVEMVWSTCKPTNNKQN